MAIWHFFFFLQPNMCVWGLKDMEKNKKAYYNYQTCFLISVEECVSQSTIMVLWIHLDTFNCSSCDLDIALGHIAIYWSILILQLWIVQFSVSLRSFSFFQGSRLQKSLVVWSRVTSPRAGPSFFITVAVYTVAPWQTFTSFHLLDQWRAPWLCV